MRTIKCPTCGVGVIEVEDAIAKSDRIAAAVLQRVALARSLFVDEISGPVRSKLLVDARAEVAYILRTEYGMALAEIGLFLNRDHSSIIHLLNRYEKTPAYAKILERKRDGHGTIQVSSKGTTE